jgi:hypothetical protein
MLLHRNKMWLDGLDGESCSVGQQCRRNDGINNNLALADIHLLRADTRKRTALVGITNLIDANLAGTEDGKKCTLALTEGDSAAAFANHVWNRRYRPGHIRYLPLYREGISHCSRL